jgi:hypothetical protein
MKEQKKALFRVSSFFNAAVSTNKTLRCVQLFGCTGRCKFIIMVILGYLLFRPAPQSVDMEELSDTLFRVLSYLFFWPAPPKRKHGRIDCCVSYGFELLHLRRMKLFCCTGISMFVIIIIISSYLLFRPAPQSVDMEELTDALFRVSSYLLFRPASQSDAVKELRTASFKVSSFF